MKTIRTKVYEFNELNDKAKQTAIEWYKNSVLAEDSDILFGFDEHCREEAEKFGFNDIKIQYSLSYCQGDGLSFSCSNFDLKQFLTNNSRLHRNLLINVISSNCTVEIKGNTGRYCFASRSDIDLYLDANKDYPNIQTIIDLIKTELENTYLQLCNELENTGYKWIEDAYTDESIIESIEANEYNFTKDGKIFNN